MTVLCRQILDKVGGYAGLFCFFLNSCIDVCACNAHDFVASSCLAMHSNVLSGEKKSSLYVMGLC